MESPDRGRFHESCVHGTKLGVALSIYALCLRPTFEKLFIGIKVQRKAKKVGVGHKKFLKLTPQVTILRAHPLQAVSKTDGTLVLILNWLLH